MERPADLEAHQRAVHLVPALETAQKLPICRAADEPRVVISGRALEIGVAVVNGFDERIQAPPTAPLCIDAPEPGQHRLARAQRVVQPIALELQAGQQAQLVQVERLHPLGREQRQRLAARRFQESARRFSHRQAAVVHQARRFEQFEQQRRRDAPIPRGQALQRQPHALRCQQRGGVVQDAVAGREGVRALRRGGRASGRAVLAVRHRLEQLEQIFGDVSVFLGWVIARKDRPADQRAVPQHFGRRGRLQVWAFFFPFPRSKGAHFAVTAGEPGPAQPPLRPDQCLQG